MDNILLKMAELTHTLGQLASYEVSDSFKNEKKNIEDELSLVLTLLYNFSLPQEERHDELTKSISFDELLEYAEELLAAVRFDLAPNH